MRLDYPWHSLVTTPLYVNSQELGFENISLSFTISRSSTYFMDRGTVAKVLEVLTEPGWQQCYTTYLSKRVHYFGYHFLLREDFTPVLVNYEGKWYHNPTLNTKTEVMLKNKVQAISDPGIFSKFYLSVKMKPFKTIAERREFLAKIVETYNEKFD